jgi:hypothetical protein
VIALGDVSVTKKEITMTHTRYAFVKANWHADIVSKAFQALSSFPWLRAISRNQASMPPSRRPRWSWTEASTGTTSWRKRS